MTDYANPARPELRLSNAERDAAVARLAEAQAEGRFSPSEYAERASAARAAVTYGDLAPLFADLPSDGRGAAPSAAFASPPDALTPPPAPTPAYTSPVSAGPASAPEERGRRGPQPLGGAIGATIMALVPFIALGLFFLTGHFGSYAWSWIWFVMIPVAGIIIYGPGSEYRRRN
ncbi:DUF1707 SHOCT-like domain-containing protein [Agromyces laixinhei]|uniref:DUF1707 SHOCT-like domain-containing protein n=1 Tax=Agromyces laixinhei TaxID=2585717 RepID=UPI00143D994F|nr:DUF1707 domain-containing protein [Agromyces laixinhei]